MCFGGRLRRFWRQSYAFKHKCADVAFRSWPTFGMRLLATTQKNRVVSLICRTNYCWMLIWRLRSAKERDQILEELDALMDRKILLKLYLTATAEKHSFWYMNLLNEQDSMWYKNFDQKMLVVDK